MNVSNSYIMKHFPTIGGFLFPQEIPFFILNRLMLRVGFTWGHGDSGHLPPVLWRNLNCQRVLISCRHAQKSLRNWGGLMDKICPFIALLKCSSSAQNLFHILVCKILFEKKNVIVNGVQQSLKIIDTVPHIKVWIMAEQTEVLSERLNA